jgi:DNA-binding XRE family transcriptional regulator
MIGDNVAKQLIEARNEAADLLLSLMRDASSPPMERVKWSSPKREIRVGRFLSMARLARLADVPVSTIRDIESGKHKPSMITCAKLAAALEMPAEQIDECREELEELEEGNKIAPATA